MTEEYDYYREDKAEPRGRVRIMEFRKDIGSLGFASEIFGTFAAEDYFPSNPITSFDDARRNLVEWAESKKYKLKIIS